MKLRTYRVEIRHYGDEEPDDAMRQAVQLLGEEIDPEGLHRLDIEVRAGAGPLLFTYHYDPKEV